MQQILISDCRGKFSNLYLKHRSLVKTISIFTQVQYLICLNTYREINLFYQFASWMFS